MVECWRSLHRSSRHEDAQDSDTLVLVPPWCKGYATVDMGLFEAGGLSIANIVQYTIS